MKILLNGKPAELPDGLRVEQLLQRLGRTDDSGRFAVAVNLDVVPRDQLGLRTLVDGDRVDVVGAVGGG